MTDAEVLATVKPLMFDYLKPHIIQAVREAHSRGGQAFAEITKTMKDSAEMWYGMYHPKVYKRGETLKADGNLVIMSSAVDVSAGEWSMDWTPLNLSPHFHWTSGFPMRNGQYRPGADILAEADGLDIKIQIDIPEDIVVACATQALGAVIGG